MEALSHNQDFSDMLSALNGSGCDYLLVGAYAVGLYAVPRYTFDIDFWVRPSADNAPKVLAAIRQFSAPLYDLTVDDLARPGLVFQIGAPPNCIHLMTSISGVEFDHAWHRRETRTLLGQRVPVIHLHDLIVNKRASGRPKDLGDLAWLEEKKTNP